METIIHIQDIEHKGEWRYFLFYDYTTALNNLVRGLPNAKYSATHKAWHLPMNEVCKLQIRSFAKLHPHIVLKKRANEPQTTVLLPIQAAKAVVVNNIKILPTNHVKKINDFKQWMQSKRYSQSSIDTYCDALKVFWFYFYEKEVSQITNDDVILFNNDYILKNNLSSSYQNQIVNAIKLFYRTQYDKLLQPDLVHRPRREHKLPNVLSKEEVKLILQAHGNIKHKTMLSLIYSCGLRRSELLNLKLNDIDSKRGLILIKQAKGKKDRIAPLSEKVLELVREYYKAYKPKEYLFEGQSGKGQYDERSLASVLKQALEKSKITKPVTLHWLRHSYATHLLEAGTDLRYIQEILGHSRSTTTEIYTHVSNKNIQKIISPFDSL